MAFQGPRSPQQVISTGPGNVAWTNPQQALTSNNIPATASINLNQTTKFLQAVKFKFSIPTRANIWGIVVEIEKRGGAVKDNSVRSVKGGTRTGNEKAAGGFWPGTDAYVSYGGDRDLWGVGWRPSDINSNGFGAAIQAIGPDAGGIADVDHIRITVHFGSGPPPPAPAPPGAAIQTSPANIALYKRMISVRNDRFIHIGY